MNTTNIADLLRAMRSHGKFTKHEPVDELARRAALVRSMVAVAARMGPISEARAKEAADSIVAKLRAAIVAQIARHGVTL